MDPFFNYPAWLIVSISVLAASGCSKRGPATGALMDAACAGNVMEVEQIVKGGVPVNATDSQGVTALQWAVFCCKIDVVRKLIALGANVNHVDRRGGHTPLMYTAT